MTSTTAAIAAILLVALSFIVSLRRAKVGADIGTGNDKILTRRVRAQGNFIEYVPLCLGLLALNEINAAGPAWLWSLALLLIGGRLLHAAGMLTGNTPARAVGMLATYGCLLVGAGLLLVG